MKVRKAASMSHIDLGSLFFMAARNANYKQGGTLLSVPKSK